jgi:endo-1,4-beta-xylanase
MLPAPNGPQYPLNLTRRAILRGLAGVSVLGLTGLLPGCADLQNMNDWSFGGPGLGALARDKGKQYGAAIQSWQLDKAEFADVIIRECGLLVPENELKWDALRPTEHSFNFKGYKKIAQFALDNHLTVRGHTLVWHAANPGWLAPALTNRKTAEKILETHITRVIHETSPVIYYWDVVNEAVSAHSSREDGLRETIWLKAIGPEYIGLAFEMAHKANPHITLVYNDFGTELAGNDGRLKRQCILRLLDQMVRKKIPVNAFGLQSHLRAHQPLAGAEFTSFVKEVRSMGLKILITELDLDVGKLRGDAEDKVKLAQNYVKAYLDMVQDSGPVDTLLTWGLSDRYTWLHQSQPKLAGCLPLDADYNRGPLWETLKTDWIGA